MRLGILEMQARMDRVQTFRLCKSAPRHQLAPVQRITSANQTGRHAHCQLLRVQVQVEEYPLFHRASYAQRAPKAAQI